MTDDQNTDDQEGRDDLEEDSSLTQLFLWLSDNSLTVVLGAGFLLFALASVLGIGVPRWLRIIGLTATGSALLIGRPTASRVKSLLYQPSWCWFIDLDLTRADGAAIYRLTEDEVQQLDVLDGELNQAGPRLYVCQNMDLDTLECHGTWRGTLDDLELARALSKVSECRGQLEEQARAGFVIDTQAFTVVRTATYAAIRRIRDTFEDGTLPDSGDGLGDAIDSALSDTGLDRDSYLTDVVDADPVDPDAVSIGINDADLATLIEEARDEVPDDD